MTLYNRLFVEMNTVTIFDSAIFGRTNPMLVTRMKWSSALFLALVLPYIYNGCVARIPEQEPIVIRPIPPLPAVSVDIPFRYPIPAEPSEWQSYNPTRIDGRVIGRTTVTESPVLRVEVRKEYGGCIQIYDKVTNQALINFYDLGRETGMSSYGGPRSFADDSPNWKGIGYNPLQAGDDGHNPSPILFHGIVDGWIYTKAQCLSWAHRDARQLPLIYEQWVGLRDNKVYVNVRLTHNRPDKTFYGAEEQEWPFVMINGARKVHFYNGSAPYTNDITTVSDGIERKGTGSTSTTQQSTPFYLTEPWQGVEIAPNRLIGMYCGNYFRANYNVAALTNTPDNGEGSNTLTYTGNRPMVHLDSDNTWTKQYNFIVGTEDEIRNFVNAQPHSPRPDFLFNKAGGRNGWYIADGGFDQKEPFATDDWRVTYTGKTENGITSARGTKLVSPAGSWPASGFDHVYIRMAYQGVAGGPAQVPLRIQWLLNRQATAGLDPNFPVQNRERYARGSRGFETQSVPFMIMNDGQMHTYRVSFAGHPLWKDIVQEFEFTHEYEPAYVAPGEVITLRYFGVNEPGN